MPGMGGPMGMMAPTRRFAAAAAPVPEDLGKLVVTHNLGTVDLQVGEDAISFGSDSIQLSVPEEHLAIRFDNPADLQGLSEEVGQLPLDQISGWIDLIPEEDGVWRGTAQLPDDRVMELIMKPVSE